MVLLPVQSRFSALPTEGQEPGCPCSHPCRLRGRAKQARQNRGANCIVKTRRVKELGIKVWLPSFTNYMGRKGLVITAGLAENGPAASNRKRPLLQHLLALRDDYADEFSCKDTLNSSKLIWGWFLLKLELASASRVHTWNKTSSKFMASEMQDTPPEPSLIGIL